MTIESIPQSSLIQPLLGVGLSKNEARVYLACLELGMASASNIALKTGLKRPTCYLILDELMLKGFASNTFDGKRTLFSVVTPKRLLASAERRLDHLSGVISQLEALAEYSTKKPLVSYFDGIQGVRDVYLGSLEIPRGSVIYFLGNDAVTEENYPGLLAEYMRIRQEKKIVIKVLFEDNTQNRLIGPNDSKKLRETRYLPKDKFSSLIEQHIAGDRVIYISHSVDRPFATVIEDVIFANQERQKFDLLWGLASE